MPVNKPFEFDVDLKQPYGIQPIKVVNNDTNSDTFIITVYENEKIVDLTGATINIAMEKSDKNVIVGDCTILDPLQGKIQYVLGTNDKAALGNVICEIQVNSPGGIKTTTTTKFKFTVVGSVDDGTGLPSTTEYTTLVNLINSTNQTNATYTEDENTRKANENIRINNEGDNTKGRVKAENDRVTAESSRASAENGRANAEELRQQNETTRQNNEINRQNDNTAYKLIEPYDPMHNYIPLNKVTFMGGAYENKLACQGVAPTYNADNDNWLCIAQAGSGTNVTNSSANGNVVINGTETKVYDDSSVVSSLAEIPNQTYITEKAKQIDLNIANSNIATNTVNINTQKGRIDNLVQTASTSYYEKCLSTDTGALLVVSSGATTGQINLASVTPVATGYTPVVSDYVRLVYGVANGSAELIDARTDKSGNTHINVNDRISGIEQDLSNGSHILNPKWESGYISGSDGSLGGSAPNVNLRTVSILTFKAGTTIKNNHTGYIRLHNYDSNNNWISLYKSIAGGTTYTLTEDLNVKLVLEYGTSTSDVTLGNSLVMVTEQSKYGVLNQIVALEPEIDDLNKNVYNESYQIIPVWELGYISGTDGSLQSNNITARTKDIIFMPKGSTIQVIDANVTIAIMKYVNGVWDSMLNTGWTMAKGIYTFTSPTYVKLNYNYTGNPVITDLNLPNTYITLNKNTIINRISILEKSYWTDKKIVWFGTSIPAGDGANLQYPIKIGTALGTTVYNEAVGSSCARAGHHSYINGSDTLGYAGLNFSVLMRSFSLSSTEKQTIFDNWATWQPLIPSAPVDCPLSADQTFYKSCSWDIKLAKYLTGGSIGQVDLYVFDHGYNDGVSGSGYNYDDLTAEPTDQFDRTYFIGAMNFLINKILTDNPRARICFIGHYENDLHTGVSLGQIALADKWKFKLFKTWEHMGWTQNTITTTGYWGADGIWVASGGTAQTLTLKQIALKDDLHPHSDKSGKATQLCADVMTPFIRDVR